MEGFVRIYTRFVPQSVAVFGSRYQTPGIRYDVAEIQIRNEQAPAVLNEHRRKHERWNLRRFLALQQVVECDFGSIIVALEQLGRPRRLQYFPAIAYVELLSPLLPFSLTYTREEMAADGIFPPAKSANQAPKVEVKGAAKSPTSALPTSVTPNSAPVNSAKAIAAKQEL